MNLSFLTPTYSDVFILSVIFILSYVIMLIYSETGRVSFEDLPQFIAIYVVYMIISKIIYKETDEIALKYFNIKNNNKEEVYNVEYINPYITNLDEVNFNKKLFSNKNYVKKILNNLLIRKYVEFNNVLTYNKNPWKTHIISNMSIPNNKYIYISDKIGYIYRKNILELQNDSKIYESINNSRNLNYEIKKFHFSDMSFELNKNLDIIKDTQIKITTDNNNNDGIDKTLFPVGDYKIAKNTLNSNRIYLKTNDNEFGFRLTQITAANKLVIKLNGIKLISSHLETFFKKDTSNDRYEIKFSENIEGKIKKGTTYFIDTDFTVYDTSSPTIALTLNSNYKRNIEIYSTKNTSISFDTNIFKIKIVETPENTVSQSIFKNGDQSTIIDTRDMLYDRQYRMKEGSDVKDLILIDIYFIYNDLSIFKEKSEINSTDTENYDFMMWLEKKYYNLMKYQFIGKLKSIYVVNEKEAIGGISNKVNLEYNSLLSEKYESMLGLNSEDTPSNGYEALLIINDKKKNVRLLIKPTIVDNGSQLITLKTLKTNNLNNVVITNKEIEIDLMKYINDYIKIDENNMTAAEYVMIKEPVPKNIKNSVDYDPNIVDYNYVSFISSKFINIKNIKDFRDKMSKIADAILLKYFSDKIDNIDKIRYNLDRLSIVNFDKMFRFNSGKYRLRLNNRVINNQNIGKVYKDIQTLRDDYTTFLRNTLQWKEKIDKIDSFPITDNELLKVLNTVPFNSSEKIFCTVTSIDKPTTPDPSELNPYNDKLIELKLKNVPFSYNRPLFVRFGTTQIINNFSIVPENIYVVYDYVNKDTSNRYNEIGTQKNCIILSNYLAEPDKNGNDIIVESPSNKKSDLNYSLYDCSNMFRKEMIGTANRIKYKNKTTFELFFETERIEFKPLINRKLKTLLNEEGIPTNSYLLDRPTYIMLNKFSENNKIDLIDQISENVLYKVLEVHSSTSRNMTSKLVVESVKDLTSTNFINDLSGTTGERIMDIRVSQFINSKDYKKNVYFEKVMDSSNVNLSSANNLKLQIKLTDQIIEIPKIFKINLAGESLDNYKKKLNEIAELIYKNESHKIRYEIPNNIGVIRDTTSAVYSYRYSDDLFVPYDKRGKPINDFKNTNRSYLCKKVYT